MIISTIIWGIIVEFSTQISTYQAIRAFLYPNDYPSDSRYSRLSVNLKEILKIVHYDYVKELDNQSNCAVLDSFPCSLCTTIRNKRVKFFFETANIGYNATKELDYYGFKISFSIDSKGFSHTYVVSSVSI